MIIYGDFIGFDCCYNGANITAIDTKDNKKLTHLYCGGNPISELDITQNTKLVFLDFSESNINSLDVSQNTELGDIVCYDTPFTTETLDALYCSLPDRNGLTTSRIKPVVSSEDENHDKVLASNKHNATSKNWKVVYYENNNEIPETNGTHECGGGVNMKRYIKLYVKNGEDISFDLMTDVANTPVKIISGEKTYDITTADEDWADFNSYTAGADSMVIYGNILNFNCNNENGDKITGIDISHNSQLSDLYCGENAISALDISKNPSLKNVFCQNNQLTSLNITQNTELLTIDCSSNQIKSLNVKKNRNLQILRCGDNGISGLILTGNPKLVEFECTHNKIGNLDVSFNPELQKLICFDNKLKNLDISQNMQLQELKCSYNEITNLDVSQNPKLTTLWAFGNPLTTDAVNALFCSLPEQESTANAKLYILNKADDENHADVIASNKQIATEKNWQVKYKGNDEDIPETNGTYVCNLNMERYITITAEKGATIKLKLLADANNTPVQIVSGNEILNITAGSDWSIAYNIKAGDSNMTIYGNLKGFNCSENGGKLTALDISKNVELKQLLCYSNNLTSLDLSKNSALENISCDGNKLTELDLSQNTNLKWIFCFNNSFSIHGIDALFCSLPQKEVADNARIYILNNTDDANYDDVLATNKQNAIAKNWQVLYFDNATGDLADKDIPATNGTYICGTGIEDIYASAVKLYPNPATGSFTVETQERGTLEIYSVIGKKISSEQITSDRQSIDISYLQTGIYIIKLNSQTFKLIKQ